MSPDDDLTNQGKQVHATEAYKATKRDRAISPLPGIIYIINNTLFTLLLFLGNL